VKFERIELPAFGPFSDFKLDLGERPAAVQLVYGPNEAGKSSLLRALVALLYGVPARSQDGHTHDFARLRIGARLRTSAGELLEIVRRKGNKHTLLDRSDQPLPEGLLAPHLGGLDEKLFTQMFGLDHVRLREGAEALLAGGGHLGEGLFDAGSGARTIRHALEALRSEADALYKPRGRSPKLNASVESLREQRRKLREAMLSPQVYVDQQRALETTRQEREQAAERRRELSAEQARLARKLSLVPSLARHAALCRREAELVQKVSEARSAEAAGGAPLDDELKALSERLATIRAFRSEEPERTARIAALERELAMRVQRLGSVASLSSELDTPARAALRLFAEEERTLKRDQQELTRRLIEHAARLEQLDTRLAPWEAVSEREARLGELLEAVQQTNLQTELTRCEAELERERAAFMRAFAQSALRVEPTAVVMLSLPGEARLHELERAFAEHEREAQRLQGELHKLQAEQARVARLRSELLAQGELARDEDLTRARASRDEALARILEGWRAGLPFDAEVAARQEREVRVVDELTARMRREAQRYAELVRTEAELAQLAAAADLLLRARTALDAAHDATRGELAALLSALHLPEDVSVRELRTRVGKLAELQARAEHIARLELERDRLGAAAAQLLGELAKWVADVPQALAAALAGARVLLRGLREQQSELRHLRNQRDELAALHTREQARLRALELESAALAARYGEALASYGLATVLTPEQLLACLDELGELAQKQRELASLQERAQHLQRLEQELRIDLARVAELCRLDVAELSLGRALEALAELGRSVVDASRELARTREERDVAERELVELAEGVTPSQLETSLRDFDVDLGRSRKLELDGELESESERIRELDQRLGALRAGLARLEEPSSAVELAEQSECELASARALSRRYVEVRLALALLTREIERYRSEHQGPVLARASELFPRLTHGRYAALEVDYGERDEPVLVCVLRSGKRVYVDGLSDGTRDQLYLALRIASIERYVANNPPLPLILDDAFVHFDDSRAEAALAVLGELAGKTQVLFFTHHARMVELAQRALGKAVMIHRLSRDLPEGVRDHGPLFS
jgi:uncharacterized protein YhaN